ncbi:MAG: hypothetical protein ABI411_08035 [Tahibacter sp.]
MTRGRPLSIAVLFGAFAMLGASTQNLAQITAPAFHPLVMPVPANQSFAAGFSLSAPYAALGMQQPDVFPIEIAENVVIVPFDIECGFICPGGTGYYETVFAMPALTAGDYRVRFMVAGTAISIAEFDLVVGGGVVATVAPTLSAPACIALIFLLSVIAWRRRQYFDTTLLQQSQREDDDVHR